MTKSKEGRDRRVGCEWERTGTWYNEAVERWRESCALLEQSLPMPVVLLSRSGTARTMSKS